MLPQCVLCGELLREASRPGQGLCLLCSHRTTLAERMLRRPLEKGVIDNT
jgi:hypothetical protein